ncbi:hypothetical protein [Blastopirellula retiformator]|uniref:Uncharacterized protein n=1 Tax=Blastopirellula retiformator TaxID=2527970 RepID=A0A5C5VMD0_9BACT|nr:hypothetical protein [Blastopirellula retiformator]TWT39035.1 hypothetical protein Enr8_07300 [Blastopirellula retiformator]
MSRYWLALACAATLLLTSPTHAEEPGEGLIDGLIAKIRHLEARLEQIETQTDKHRVAIERTTENAIRPKEMAELFERQSKLGQQVEKNLAAIKHVESHQVPPEVIEELMKRLEVLGGQVDENGAAIKSANAKKVGPPVINEVLGILKKLDVRVDQNAGAIRDIKAKQEKPAIDAEPKLPKRDQAEKREAAISLAWKPKEPIDFAGTWLMTLPLGAEHQVVIKATRDDKFKLVRPKLNMAGVYQANGEKLTITKPDDKRLTGFEWTAINRNTLILTGEPSTSRTGSSYLGATLTRQVEAKSDSK